MNTNALELAARYQKNISKSIDNYQRMFGIQVEIFRVSKKKHDTYLDAYGAHRVVHDNEEKLESKGKIYLLANPMQMYTAYTGGATNELEVSTSRDTKLMLGDVIQYIWNEGTDKSILKFQVTELPQTWSNTYFTYKIKGMFSTVQAK